MLYGPVKEEDVIRLRLMMQELLDGCAMLRLRIRSLQRNFGLD